LAARKPSRSVAVVVLAAGQGKRMKSALPKVLHPVCGRPALWHVLRSAAAAKPNTLVVVVGHDRDQVIDAVRSWGLAPKPLFAEQGEPLGTGHAVVAAERATAKADDVLVLAGDDPLVTRDQVRDVLRVHRRTRAAATILTTVVDDPGGYGRVIREGSDLVDIVQEVDATPAQRAIREISTLVYVFRREELYRALPLVGRDNRQREYYLPDVLRILKDKGEKISAVEGDFGGALGLNSRGGLAAVSAILRRRILDGHLANGVTVVDPETTYVDVEVRIGRDTTLHPLTFLEGSTRVGAGARIGPSTRLVDTEVGEGAEVTFSVVRGSRIGPRASVGPFASLRPGTVLREGSKAGTFVEMKSTRIGRGSKVPHLSYMGDATIGEGVNVGAGSITCNYDGVDKHPTVIEDGAFIGSDTMLVAPVRVGRNAVTGAGSAITRDVPAGALAVERAEQRTVEGYGERRQAARQAKRRGRTRSGGEHRSG